MITYKSESDVYPIEWDMTSSRISNYHNYNVKQVERIDDIDYAETRIVYVYDVDEYSKDEFTVYISDKMTETELQMANYCVDLDYRLLLIEWGIA